MATLLPGELSDIEEELRSVLETPEAWLQMPSSLFGGQRPAELIGTPDEDVLRQVVRQLKHGVVS